jgi:MoaA/NifB/PqqE/SkfB family radical SAM enzyme
MMGESIKIKFIANRNQILYINSILDSYDGIGIMRTIDREKGHIAIYSTESQYKKVLDLLKALKREGIYIKDISVERSEDVDSW